MSEPFNKLSQAELERLAILSEELGEVQQIIGKIIRHGWESYSPFDESKTTNRQLLEKELGDVHAIRNLMIRRGDIDFLEIKLHGKEKEKRIQPYLHHNKMLEP